VENSKTRTSTRKIKHGIHDLRNRILISLWQESVGRSLVLTDVPLVLVGKGTTSDKAEAGRRQSFDRAGAQPAEGDGVLGVLHRG
jgi:hypothetical protein